MYSRLDRTKSDISDDHIASIFRIEDEIMKESSRRRQ
jgi:hypothetical protein